ncbi:MAG: CPBP family intramembrane glutamic endopeptidase [bacterium]
MTTGARGESRGYWELSRSHRYSLLFALPLLLAYEFFEAMSPVRVSGGVVRNGADVVLTDLFIWMLGPRGPLVFMAVVIGLSLWLIRRDRGTGPLRVRTFAAMAVESGVLALLFGIVVGTLTMRVLGPLRSLSAGGDVGGTAVAKITLSLGAGLYEELLFRVVIVSAFATGFRFLGFGRLFSGVVATIFGALLFSAFHYVGPLGEPFRLESFVFRAIAGLAFSALYLTRGFGITAWTHALYDVAVML